MPSSLNTISSFVSKPLKQFISKVCLFTRRVKLSMKQLRNWSHDTTSTFLAQFVGEAQSVIYCSWPKITGTYTSEFERNLLVQVLVSSQIRTSRTGCSDPNPESSFALKLSQTVARNQFLHISLGKSVYFDYYPNPNPNQRLFLSSVLSLFGLCKMNPRFDFGCKISSNQNTQAL